MNYVFPPAPQVVLPVVGRDVVFPVRRVYCVDPNYSDHSIEMGVDTREPPFSSASRSMRLCPVGVT